MNEREIVDRLLEEAALLSTKAIIAHRSISLGDSVVSLLDLNLCILSPLEIYAK